MKGFFDISDEGRSDEAVVNIIYDSRKKKFLMIRKGRRKAYVAFDSMPTINMMGKRMREE